MSKVVNVVVVGYGGMGGWHVKKMAEIDEVCVKGVYDIDASRHDVAKENGVFAYDSYEAVLADEDVDVITIATPNDVHKEIALKAFEAGKNVVCEKPVTMNSADLEEIIAGANKYGKLFTVHQNRRWDEDFKVAKMLFQTENELGRVFNVESRVHGSRGIPGDWRNRKAQGGGMVLDWGVHLLDQMLQMTEKMPISVSAELFNVTNEEVDDGFRAIFKYENDVSFLIEVGTSNFVSLPRWYILGLNGTAVIENFNVDGKKVVATTTAKHDAVPIITAAGLTKTMAPRTDDTIKELPIDRIESDIKDYYKNVAAYLNGEAEIIVTHDQQRNLMKVMEAIFESAEQNKTVYFN